MNPAHFLSSMVLTLAAASLAVPTPSRAEAATTDKTLVAWVTLPDKTLRAGSVLTVQHNGRFDGIVFAELAPGKWMAGSELFLRSQQDQADYPDETTGGTQPVQMAVVYAGDTSASIGMANCTPPMTPATSTC